MVDRRKLGQARMYRVLYFINAPAPDDDERLDIEQYGGGAVFRNATYIDPESDEGFEPCVAVAGKVPANYARYFPLAVPLEEFHAGMLGAAPEQLDAERIASQGPVDDAMPTMSADPFAVGRPQANWAKNTPVA